MKWMIEGTGGTVTVDCDEVTSRPDGSLWLLQETASGRPPKLPVKLVPVLVVARGAWRQAYPADGQPDWVRPPVVGSALQAPRPSRILPSTVGTDGADA